MRSPVWVVKTPCLPLTIRSDGVTLASVDRSSGRSEVQTADAA